MLTKLPRHTRNMDKSDNSETWTSAGGRAWVGGGTPPPLLGEGGEGRPPINLLLTLAHHGPSMPRFPYL